MPRGSGNDRTARWAGSAGMRLAGGGHRRESRPSRGVVMRNLMPAAVAALSFGTVWTAGSFGLEALINPSARLAPGFGTVTLELSNTRKLSGILLEEKASTLKLKIGDRPDTLIQKTDVVRRTDAASSMPPMRLLLTKKEIRDVLSFLATMEE